MFSKILLPIDHTDEASWANVLPLAKEEAKLHGAELSVVAVIPEILRLPNLPANYGEGAAAHVEGEIRKIVGDEIPITVREGSVYREILKEAHAIKADLIVLASAKGDFPDYPFGPNAARVVRHANCSVLVHRG